jgi:hypothetical protein
MAKQHQEIALEGVQAAAVHLVVSDAWAATLEHHRILIRQDLAQTLQLQGETETQILQALLDLTRTPKLSSTFISISHCPQLGGWAMSKSPVGLDLEVIERVQPKLVQRVLTPMEKEHLPDGLSQDAWAGVWVAKEASWKAIHNRASRDDGPKPKTISELSVIWGELWGAGSFQVRWEDATVHGEILSGLTPNVVAAVSVLGQIV